MSEVYETPRLGLTYDKNSSVEVAHEKDRNDVLTKTAKDFNRLINGQHKKEINVYQKTYKDLWTLNPERFIPVCSLFL